MTFKALPRVILFAFAVLLPSLSQAWWHADWAYRKQLTIEPSQSGAAANSPLTEVQVLVRLHSGNFGYFLDVQPQGQDIRFVDSDDKTPLKFHIERFDPVNQMALIWVKLPLLQPGTPHSIWMYYGNAAVGGSGQDAAGTYDTPQALVLHFNDPQRLGLDSTAYGNHAETVSVVSSEGPIGAAAQFDGSSGMTIPAGRGLLATPETGFTFSTWLQLQAEQNDAVLMQWNGVEGNLLLRVQGNLPQLQFVDASGAVQQVASSTPLKLNTWQQLALVGDHEGLKLYIDGQPSASLPGVTPTLNGSLQIGVGDDAQGALQAQVDEVAVATIARSPAWLLFSQNVQAADSLLLQYGEDGQQDSAGGADTSYFATILHSVTLDGWVVIVLLAIMAAISWVVMLAKGFVINRVRRDNNAFLKQFAQLGSNEVGQLDSQTIEVEASPLLTALSGRHAHFESSNIYRLYHTGVQEMQHRMPKAVGAQAVLSLTPQAVGAIKATLDGALVRELQRLNSQMVLLTIAISGGPFLGLLGTVVGVMITFAAIAATGDVNVNAIAPGIAAALVATVAGLAVAIPALFGYNYLGSRIKDITADMQVFVDEFVAKIAERHS